MKIGIQTKKSMPSSELTKQGRGSNFKMAAADIVLIQMNAVKWAITTQFWWNLIHKLRKMLSVQKLQERK
jgi:hypothetical protein